MNNIPILYDKDQPTVYQWGHCSTGVHTLYHVNTFTNKQISLGGCFVLRGFFVFCFCGGMVVSAPSYIFNNHKNFFKQYLLFFNVVRTESVFQLGYNCILVLRTHPVPMSELWATDS